MHVLLQYQSKSYYIIGQEVYYSIGRFYYIIGQLLQYRAFITLSVGTAAVFTFNPYLLISINELLISIIHLLISINIDTASIFIDINNSFIDINNSFIDINKDG